MTYIVINENEIVKAEMERPVEPDINAYGKHTDLLSSDVYHYEANLEIWKDHCLSLPRIPIKGKHKWEVWQSVPESEIRWQYQYCKQDNIYRWFNCEKIDYIGWPKHLRRIVAIPIQPTPEGEKVQIDKVVNDHYDKFFGDGYWEREYKKHIVTFAKQCINLLNNDNTQTK